MRTTFWLENLTGGNVGILPHHYTTSQPSKMTTFSCMNYCVSLWRRHKTMH